MTLAGMVRFYIRLKRSALLLGCMVFSSATLAVPDHAPQHVPQTVSQVDLRRYLGTWYEIARFPMYFQRNCASDVTATYGLQTNDSISVLNQCRKKNGEIQASRGQASPVDSSNSKLKVSFLPKGLRWLPFTQGDYWILKLDNRYETVLIGTPNYKYLWILSRTPDLDESTYQRYVDAARQQGFDTQKLLRTIHTP